MNDIEAWGIVLESGHWDHGGWSTDSRDGLLVCACGETLAEPEKPDGMHPIHQAYADALAAGGPAEIPLGRTVLCDIDDTDLTDDPRGGGYMFGTYAVGPCCAERYLVTIRGYNEEHFIRSRCPEGVRFADWIRDMRGPGAAITITPGRPGGAG